MTAAIDLVTQPVRDWLLEHGPRVGRLARLGDGVAISLTRAYADLQTCADENVDAQVRKIEQIIEAFSEIWGAE